MDDRRIPPAALWLGLGGLIPFLACLLAIWTGLKLPLISDPARAMLGYAAVILSFLGGVRWGLAMRSADPAALTIAVLPSIGAWLLLLLPTVPSLAVMPFFFLVLGLMDRQLAGEGIPAWYAQLRTLLTTVVVLALLAAAAGAAR